MRQTLDAVYENGVFKPLDSPGISEGQTVRLIIEAIGEPSYPALKELLRQASERDDGTTSWLLPTLERLLELLRLPPGWNSYGSRPISPECVAFALAQVLPSIMRPHLPLPAVVPTGKGGVQLEWHTQGVDLEIEIASGRKVYASYEEVHEGSVWEGEVTEDLAPLAGVLSKLSNHVPA